jgi:hypothetical protein
MKERGDKRYKEIEIRSWERGKREGEGEGRREEDRGVPQHMPIHVIQTALH